MHTRSPGQVAIFWALKVIINLTLPAWNEGIDENKAGNETTAESVLPKTNQESGILRMAELSQVQFTIKIHLWSP